MPKIIENIRGMLIEEAQNQIIANGYENVTIRSIARGCGLGLGTFYNYFKSKDTLIATFLLEDWQKRISKVEEATKDENDPMTVVRELHNEIENFIKVHHSIFSAPSAIKAFNMTSANYHRFVRNQVSIPIYNVCVKENIPDPEFLALFVAESIITWTVDKKDFEEVAAIIKKLFVK